MNPRTALYAVLIIVLVKLLACAKCLPLEVKPTDMRIKKKVEQLQGYCKPVDGECSCQLVK